MRHATDSFQVHHLSLILKCDQKASGNLRRVTPQSCVWIDLWEMHLEQGAWVTQPPTEKNHLAPKCVPKLLKTLRVFFFEIGVWSPKGLPDRNPGSTGSVGLESLLLLGLRGGEDEVVTIPDHSVHNVVTQIDGRLFTC